MWMTPLPTRFTELVGCLYPLQQAGMGGITTADLAIAVSQAGGLGMLTGTVGHDALSAQLDVVPEDVPVGVNFLMPFIDQAALELAAARSALVEFFWGVPSAREIDIVHNGGALSGWQVGSVKEALEARDAGCDVIVAQGTEAGGHVRGTIGVLPLLDEVRGSLDLPIVAAGGIGTGRAMAAALIAGADAVRVGTRFMAAIESNAHPAYVEALIRSGAEDTTITTAFGEGWPDAPHRVLKSALAAGEALGKAQVWTPDWPSSDFVGPVEARALYAGESVGAVRSREPASTIVAELVTEAKRLLSQGVEA
jgi:NAD(P)H-dependent flavin oxidoreductase YrpB (nitropropane dioxygenase family)